MSKEERKKGKYTPWWLLDGAALAAAATMILLPNSKDKNYNYIVNGGDITARKVTHTPEYPEGAGYFISEEGKVLINYPKHDRNPWGGDEDDEVRVLDPDQGPYVFDRIEKAPKIKPPKNLLDRIFYPNEDETKETTRLGRRIEEVLSEKAHGMPLGDYFGARSWVGLPYEKGEDSVKGYFVGRDGDLHYVEIDNARKHLGEEYFNGGKDEK
ncbi:hypothetical protein CMI47_18610 [Candidatus Pacearchaeota archaeon]|nr:hypothetical protein [Candidatus Pacearchaeota archaeon]